MLSFETPNVNDNDSSDEDVSFADMLVRIAKEKEESQTDAGSTTTMGATTIATSPQMNTASQEMLLHPPRTEKKRQRHLRMRGTSMWLLRGNLLRKDQRRR